MSVEQLFIIYGTQFLNGLAFSMLLFLLAAGLSLIFGMMDFINLAHGSFYMLGAYLAFTIARQVGNFWLALALVPVAVGILGLLLERSVLHPLYKRGHLDQVLLTFGLAFVVNDVVRWVWGGDVRGVSPPAELRDSVTLFGLFYPKYRLFVILMGLGLAAALWFIQARTRLGAIIRAGVHDPEMTDGLGINITRVFTMVFAFGAGLAGLSGVIAGPMVSLSLAMDFDTLILALIVVVLGGLGTLKGAFWGALLVGEADTFGKMWLPELNLAFIFAVMAAVLLLRPSGLFGKMVS